MQEITGQGPVAGHVLVCPCHGRPVTGGPARVWCPRSGRSFQADDPQLMSPAVAVAARGGRPAVAA